MENAAAAAEYGEMYFFGTAQLFVAAVDGIGHQFVFEREVYLELGLGHAARR